MTVNFCSKCGESISQNSNFCSACGTRVEVPTETLRREVVQNQALPEETMRFNANSPKDNKLKTLTKKQIIGFVIVLCLTVVGLISKYVDGQNRSYNETQNSTISSNQLGNSTQSANQYLGKGLLGIYQSDWSACSPGLRDGTVTCLIGYTLENTNSKILNVDVDFYALVGGVIFKADDNLGADGTYPSISKDFNPGEKGKGSLSFTVPTGSLIQKVFGSITPDISKASFVFNVNLKAVSQ